VTHTYVEVEPGVRLHVQDVGAGPPVVLLAGFGLDHEVWDGAVCGLLPERRVLAVDLRGTGLSDKPAGGYDMPRLAADVLAVLEGLDLRDVALVGHSFGGQVALAVAGISAGPERVRRLVLVGSHGVRASRSEDFPFGRAADKTEAALVSAERDRRPAARRANIAGAFLAEPDPDLVDWLVRIQLLMPSWAAIACYHTYLTTDLTHILADLRVPVGQILGAKDPVTDATAAAWLAQRLPAVEQVIIEDCGHYPMFEARERFDAVLTDLIDR
jgi:pimeloyl-ACP methyl ester carboxylesterase